MDEDFFQAAARENYQQQVEMNSHLAALSRYAEDTRDSARDTARAASVIMWAVLILFVVVCAKACSG